MIVLEKYIPKGKVIKFRYKDKNGNIINSTITRRIGRPLDWDTITVHNTGNEYSNAHQEINWLQNIDNTRSASYNAVIFEDTVIKVVPYDEESWHSATSVGNKTSLGLEICESGNFELTKMNSAKYIAELLHSKKKGIESVRTHKSWSGKNCPRLLLPIWEQYLQLIQNELDILNKVVNVTNKTLRKGSKGTDVKLLQDILNKFGYNLIVDGDFGTKTYIAVSQFQRRNSLYQDGIVGAKTWHKLLNK